MMNRYLQHHGVEGQKWGVRRYQNEDGSLTEAGRKRYIKRDGSLTKEGRSLYNEVSMEQREKMLEAYNMDEAAKNMLSLSMKFNEAFSEWADLMETTDYMKDSIDRVEELESAMEKYSKEYQKEADLVTKNLLDKYGSKPIEDMYRTLSTYYKDQDGYMKNVMSDVDLHIRSALEERTLPMWY